MYRLSPYTYLIEGLVGQGQSHSSFVGIATKFSFSMIAVGKHTVTCAPVELVTLNPPSGKTCGAFMQQYMTSIGGYLTNPDDSSDCHFCSIHTTDQFLAGNFNILYSNHWRDFGIMLAFVAFNVRCSSVLMVFKSLT